MTIQKTSIPTIALEQIKKFKKEFKNLNEKFENLFKQKLKFKRVKNQIHLIGEKDKNVYIFSEKREDLIKLLFELIKGMEILIQEKEYSLHKISLEQKEREISFVA